MAKATIALMACCAIALSVASAGCRRLSARTVPEPPPLDMPAPPPRVVEAADAEPPPSGTLVNPPAGGAPSSRRPPARAEAPKLEPPKPEPPATPVADVPPPPDPARTPPATILQTTPPEREAAVEQQIRAMLARAASNLNRVDYQRLNVDAKAQYDQAKRWMTLAEESLQSKNLVYAQQLAKNASDIAAQLAGR